MTAKAHSTGGRYTSLHVDAETDRLWRLLADALKCPAKSVVAQAIRLLAKREGLK